MPRCVVLRRKSSSFITHVLLRSLRVLMWSAFKEAKARDKMTVSACCLFGAVAGVVSFSGVRIERLVSCVLNNWSIRRVVCSRAICVCSQHYCRLFHRFPELITVSTARRIVNKWHCDWNVTI